MNNRWNEAAFILFSCYFVAIVAYKLTASSLTLVIGTVVAFGLVLLRSTYYISEAGKPVITERGNQVRVDIIQNGPFETHPSGSAWYQLDSTIEITAFPVQGHDFKNWTSNTDLLGIANALSPKTTVLVRGPGIITAIFH